MSSSSRILVGIDFAFSYPYIEFKSYFPDCKTINPNTVFQLWECIEKQNQGQEDLYGGGIWDNEILGEYYNSPVKRGKLYCTSQGTNFRFKIRNSTKICFISIRTTYAHEKIQKRNRLYY